MNKKDLSLLALRMILAGIFLYHGAPKAFDWALATGKFMKMGFPGFLGPIVGITEVLGGVMLIIGARNRETNLALAGIISVAILGVQIPGALKAGKFLTAGLERDLLMLLGHGVLLAFGAGALKIKAPEKQMSQTKAHV